MFQFYKYKEKLVTFKKQNDKYIQSSIIDEL